MQNNQRTIINRRIFHCQTLLASLIPLGLAGRALAQTNTVKFILPVSAGSGVDGIARAASNQLAKALGASVVIDNQPGAGGVVGTQNMIKSAPDGSTLSFVSNNHVIYPSVLKSVPFDPVADITPIAVVGATPLVLVVNKDLPVNNLKEFVALLKANPGKYNYGSSGNGTILHLACEVFKDVSGTFSTHIPYRGVAPMLTDTMSGQVHWSVSALPTVIQQVRSGNLKALCVASPSRIPAMAELPTSAEGGQPKFLVEGWIAVVGPKGLGAAHVKRIHAALVSTFATQEVKEAMAKQGNTIHVLSQEATVKHFKDELVRYAHIVKKAGVVPA